MIGVMRMKDISTSVKKKDHDPKTEGWAEYVGDYDVSYTGRKILCGKLLRSTRAKARVLSVSVPPLPAGYWYVDASDVPGDNSVGTSADDMPVFCRGTVEYIGEPIGMVAGPDEKVVRELLKGITVEYAESEPVIDFRISAECFFDHEYGHGDVEQAFAEADKVYEEEFSTGRQDHAYLEPQGMTAEPEEGGGMFVHGSLENVYRVRDAVARALGVGTSGVHVLQDVTGGGFGGKEDFPSVLGCQTAVAARKCGKPVRCVFDRREDLEFTPKRHPSICRYRAAVRDGRVTAVDAEIRFDAGAYPTLSDAVLRRGMIAAHGVYDIPNIHVTGRAVKTNTVPCGAFRGLGTLQTFFAVETFMSHIAQDLGEDTAAFKARHFAKQGGITSTQGRYRFPVPLSAMLEKIDGMSGLRRKHDGYSRPQTGRYRRGIGFAAVFQGAGFSGAGERDRVKAVVKLHKYPGGKVEVLVSDGDSGQGSRTAFPKIVAHELDIPIETVYYDQPDTARVPDSGSAAASRSEMIVGELLRRAAFKLRGIWKNGAEQEVEERYREPDFMIPFSADRFEGDAYPDYSWAIAAVEVEVDTCTGLTKILGAYGCFDAGTPADCNIAVGRMEGGLLQGLGCASIERMAPDGKGRIRNNRFTDYLIPTAVDVPNLAVELYNEENPGGPYGAKDADELPAAVPAPAYIEAVEMALGGAKKHSLSFIPFGPEDVMNELSKEAR